MMTKAQRNPGGSSRMGKQRQWFLDATMFVDVQRKIEALRIQRIHAEAERIIRAEAERRKTKGK